MQTQYVKLEPNFIRVTDRIEGKVSKVRLFLTVPNPSFLETTEQMLNNLFLSAKQHQNKYLMKGNFCFELIHLLKDL